MKTQVAKLIFAALLCLLISPTLCGQSDQEKKDLEKIRLQERLLKLQDLKAREMAMVEMQRAQLLQYHYLAQSGIGGLTSDPSQLIGNRQVHKDLELDRDQVRELDEIQKDFRKQIQEGIKQAQNGNKFDSKKWNDTLKRINEDRKAALGAVLLPHQSKRLKQIATQMEIKSKGDVKTLIGKSVAEELGIDDQQKRRLQERSVEIKAELEADIARAKEKARQKLLRELRPDQREKFKDMIGDKFEYQKKTKSQKGK